MTTLLGTFRAQVDQNLGDKTDSEIYDNDARDTQIKAAVEDYSRDTPGIAVGDVTGDAGRYYPLTGDGAVLSAWVDGFSQIVEIEYPAATIASDELPQYIEHDDWRDDYEAGSIKYLLLPNHAPAATETMRITYTIPYEWNTNSVDTPSQHFYAICALATAKCCRAIAATYGNTNDPTLGLDSVDHGSRSDRWRRLADHYEKAYREALGLDADSDKAGASAGGFVDWDNLPGWPSGRRFLFHGNR